MLYHLSIDPFVFAFGKIMGIVGLYAVIYLVDFSQNLLGFFYSLFSIIITLILSITFCIFYLVIINNLITIYRIKQGYYDFSNHV